MVMFRQLSLLHLNGRLIAMNYKDQFIKLSNTFPFHLLKCFHYNKENNFRTRIPLCTPSMAQITYRQQNDFVRHDV